MHKFLIEEKLEKIMIKLERKNKILYEQLKKKVSEIISSDNIEHYKNLTHNMKDLKRVHVGHFVLVFSFDKKNNLISFEDFDHHDNIYK